MAKIARRSRIFTKAMVMGFFLFGLIAICTSILAGYILYNHLTDEYMSKGKAIASAISSSSTETLLTDDAATVQAMMDQYLSIKGVAYVYVRNGEGEIIAHTFVPQIPKQIEKTPQNPNCSTIREYSFPSLGKIIDIGEPVLAGAAGYVHVGMDKDLIVSYFWDAIIKMQILLFFIYWGCVFILYYSVSRIAKPLHKLTDYAEKLAVHDFSGDIHIDSKDEIGLLSKTMKSMANELSTKFTNLEEEVAKSTANLQQTLLYQTSIIDNLADGLLMVSPVGEVTMLNPAIRSYFDLESGDFTGWNVRSVFPSEVADLSDKIRRCSDEMAVAEVPLSNDRIGKAVGTSVCIKDPAMQCLGGVILIRDITHEKELDRLKTDFISTVSHELRTPMTSVLGFTKIIRKKLQTILAPALEHADGSTRAVMGQVQENMGIIVAEAERLTELINDVLDIAKMESGKVDWRDQMFSMAEVIRHSVDSSQGLSEPKGQEIIVDIEPKLPAVMGDRDRLVQVMLNLLSNAIKFTGNSPIVISSRLESGMLVTSVQDKGPGIPNAELETIFEKFKQVGDTLTEKPTGTGLGLPICKQIVKRHGGDIWVTSTPGVGSTFNFTLPIMLNKDGSPFLISDAGPQKPTCESEMEIMKRDGKAMLVKQQAEKKNGAPLILVVDDDPALTSYLSQLFEDSGYRVIVATDGIMALEMAKEHLPNLITMDIMMPAMDGRTCVKCLRMNPFTRHIPVVVISALADAESAGGDIALVKPIDHDRLLEIVDSMLLERDIKRSCIVLGTGDERSYEELTVLCPEKITFCPPEDIWSHIDAGFQGAIFIPAEISQEFELDALTKVPKVQIVILPTSDEEKPL